MAVTRGFTGKRRPERPERLPPGQYDTGRDWPTLTAEATPDIAPEDWTITVDGLVERPHTWSWREAHALPGSTYFGDIHCVTSWSKLDTTFGGLAVDELLAIARPRAEAAYVMAHCSTGYTTNLPLEDVTGGKAWLAWEYDGRPLPVDHGGPVRLLVPHLYFWKSAKWLNGFTLMNGDEPGFWEGFGYHNYGDPWREERYAGD